MEELWTGIGVVIGIFLAIMILIAYHKHFFVIYFDFAHGIFAEIMVSLFFGILIVVLAYVYWPVVVLGIGLFAFWNIRKTNDELQKKKIIIMAVIFLVLVSVLGIGAWIFML